MIEYLTRLCPICDNKTGSVLHTVNFILPEQYTLPDHYDVVSCCRCGFIYADTPAEQIVYDEFYRTRSKYENIDYSSGGNVNEFDRNRFINTFYDLSSLLKPDSFIIDIGCANGGLLDTFKNIGFKNLLGIDPSARCTAYLHDQLEIPALNSSIMDINSLNILSYGKPEMVIMSHVLEHIRDVRTVMNVLKSICSHNCLLYIEVPDSNRYCDLNHVPFYYFDIEHINHFNITSLKYLLSLYGFDAVKVISKTFEVSSGNYYPAIGIISQKTDIEPLPIQNDTECTSNIVKYIACCAVENNQSLIPNELLQDTSIIIWGAGSLATRILSEGFINKDHIIGFIDNDTNKWGLKIFGIKVEGPELLYMNEAPVLILSVMNSSEVEKQIHEMDPRRVCYKITGL